MVGTPLKNLRMFKGICGRNAFKNVILITTMWDTEDRDTAEIREAELKGTYWKSMVDLHSRVGRFEGTRHSAFRLIAPLLSETNSRIALSIQKELVDFDFRLSETYAGQVLRLEIERSTKLQQETLDHIREELKRPNNATSLQSLMEEYEELKRSSSSLSQQMADLQMPLGRRVMNTATRALGLKRNRCVCKF